MWCQQAPTDAPAWEATRTAADGVTLQPHSPAALHAIAARLGPRRAAGRDGGRTAEVHILPRCCWERAAQYFDLVEKVGRWPSVVAGGLIVLLPKGTRTLDIEVGSLVTSDLTRPLSVVNADKLVLAGVFRGVP